jgi:hypothetical protein
VALETMLLVMADPEVEVVSDVQYLLHLETIKMLHKRGCLA